MTIYVNCANHEHAKSDDSNFVCNIWRHYQYYLQKSTKLTLIDTFFHLVKLILEVRIFAKFSKTTNTSLHYIVWYGNGYDCRRGHLGHINFSVATEENVIFFYIFIYNMFSFTC